MNIVSCTTWVKKGVAAAIPDKVELTKEELCNIIDRTREDLGELNASDSEDEERPSTSRNQTDEPMDEDDEFNFKDYDKEDGSIQCKFSDLIVLNENEDPFITASDDEDSEKEDDIIKPDDNLVLVGKVDGTASLLEVYVYNDREGSFYCHHHVFLSAFPLCIEWLDFDPGDAKSGNLAAVGSMSPVIEVWDLDIVNCLEPAFKLGCKASKKKKRKAIGHKDAVLDLAWNIEYRHILASGSVDQTVLLWDLENGKPATKLSAFEEKVQSIEWSTNLNSCLLTGCADKYVRLFDCTTDNNFKAWQTSGEVERVTWNKIDPNICFISTNKGTVECIDIRKEDDVLWKKKIDEKEITGLCTSQSEVPALVTASASGDVIVWDMTDYTLGLNKQICHKTANLGTIQCLSGNPDNPHVFVAGGDKKAHNLRVFDFSKQTQMEPPS